MEIKKAYLEDDCLYVYKHEKKGNITVDFFSLENNILTIHGFAIDRNYSSLERHYQDEDPKEIEEQYLEVEKFTKRLYVPVVEWFTYKKRIEVTYSSPRWIYKEEEE